MTITFFIGIVVLAFGIAVTALHRRIKPASPRAVLIRGLALIACSVALLTIGLAWK